MGRFINFKSLFLILLFLVLVFTRFYNLSGTTRFTFDESSALLSMHNFYVEKKITFVGPLDQFNAVVYPSTTLYMLLPFAILGNFSPWSPAYGTAFYGILTCIIFILMARKLKYKSVFLFSIFVSFWYPLLFTSRWAWNPHLVPFAMSLAILFFLKKGKYWKFLSGIAFGLSFQLHFATIISFLTFGLIFTIDEFRKKRFQEVLFLGLGFIVMIVPFVVFDLRHPPGLFFTHYTKDNYVVNGFNAKLTAFRTTVFPNFYNALYYFTQSKIITALLGVDLLLLIYLDFGNNRKSLIYLLPFLAQTAFISFLTNYQDRYVLLGSSFFVVWLLCKRGRFGSFLSKFALLLMLFGSLLVLKRTLTVPVKEPDTYSLNQAVNIMSNEIKEKNLKNVNLAVLASPDAEAFGLIYRHVLSIRGIDLKLTNEYDFTDNLFVISTSSEEVIRHDPANLINNFRNGRVVETFQIPDSKWMVYLFNK